MRERLFTHRVVEHLTGSPGKWSKYQPERVQETFEQCSWVHGVSLWVFCTGPDDDPSNSAYSTIL